MRNNRLHLHLVLACLLCPLCAMNIGCVSCQPCRALHQPPADVPHELEKMTLPSYVIEPPDILLIDAVRTVPLPPYKIEALDVLLIQATGTLPNEPISGIISVEPEGTINLGPTYGSVRVAGMTMEEARAAIEKHLKGTPGLKDPRVNVSLAQSRAMQQVRGEHLVRPDGTVGLGTYGSVPVAGMTLDEARATIEATLSQYMLNPQISVDVFAYNSKFYYIVFDGGGYGQTIYRLPITGNETVLDALSQINGLPAVSSQKIWVARPNADGSCKDHVLPVKWREVVQCASSDSNYQLYPGDRIYVKADGLICADNWIAKILSPIERVFGVTLLGQQTILSFDRSLLTSRNGGGGIGGF
jgi:polysaccharide export outer membrane protein